MKFIITFAAIFSFTAKAQFLGSLCQKRVQNIEYHLPFISDGESLWTESGELLFRNDQRYLSMAHVKDNFFFLTNEELIEKDSAGREINRYTLPSLSVLSYGKRLLNHGDLVIVLHEDGASAFDLTKKEFIWIHSNGDLTGGVMVDGTIINDQIVILLANGYEGAFVGVVTLSLNGERVKTQKWDLFRSGFIDHRARIHWAGDKLLINNSGWMQFIDAKQLRGSKGLRVKLSPTYVLDSQGGRRHLDMMGDFYFFTNEAGKREFAGCGKYTFQDNGEIKQGADLYSFKF